MKRKFIVFPKTEIHIDDKSIEIVNTPLKLKIKSFIISYKEDFKELPSIETLQSIFRISKMDAHMALIVFDT